MGIVPVTDGLSAFLMGIKQSARSPIGQAAR
jgi:hypothetical protein